MDEIFARIELLPAVGVMVISPDDVDVDAPFTRVEGPTSIISATRSTALYLILGPFIELTLLRKVSHLV